MNDFVMSVRIGSASGDHQYFYRQLTWATVPRQGERVDAGRPWDDPAEVRFVDWDIDSGRAYVILEPVLCDDNWFRIVCEGMLNSGWTTEAPAV